MKLADAKKAAEESVGRLEQALVGRDTSRKDRGPRPTPKAQTPHKRRRVAARAARRNNR